MNGWVIAGVVIGAFALVVAILQLLRTTKPTPAVMPAPTVPPAPVQEPERALRRELGTKLIRLRFTIERRNREPIPMDQILEILGLAKELGDEYVIAECDEMRKVLERNYNGGNNVRDLFENSRKDYDSVRARVGYVLDRLEKPAGGGRRITWI